MNGKQIPIKHMGSIEPIDINSVDEINHPQHYTAGKIEVIDYIMDKLTKQQFEGYCIGNVMKYVSRYRFKGGMSDLEKARWYLEKLIARDEQ